MLCVINIPINIITVCCLDLDIQLLRINCAHSYVLDEFIGEVECIAVKVRD